MVKKAKTIQDESGKITDAHVNDGLLQKFANQADNPAEAKLLLRIARAQRELIAGTR
ncbi:hypothetical protein [Lentilactobacillus rapi]|uniref:hypothetical protein n=1 Tax=Lentilactobacillus rapi TaxID=481723 RepID=UPI000B20FEE7|nr:hypothetical protein [Lentilactobacillus rapi]